MSLKLFGCVCGQFHSPAAGLGMVGDRVAVPMPFYVIEHRDGIALFDCGVSQSLLDPNDRYRAVLRSQELDVSCTQNDMVAMQLERLDIDPSRVRFAVVSHLHFDHVGGLHQLPNATVVVQRREWDAGFDDELARHYFLRRRFFDLGHEIKLVDGEHDLFGDRSVTCLPTHGHTPGHQSLRVRGDQGDFILIGDACYHHGVVATRDFPSNADHNAMNESLDRLLEMRESKTVMVFGHDPGQWGERPVLPSGRESLALTTRISNAR